MIAVIGGGPVGSYAAYLLAKKGHQVEVFDEPKDIGRPVACTGILTPQIGEVVKLSKEFHINTCTRTRVYSPNGKSVEIKIKPNPIFDRANFDAFIAKMAEDEGVKINLSHKLKALDGKKIDVNGKILEPDYIIGADGPASMVAKSKGILGNRKFSVGVQARVQTKCESDLVEFWLGRGEFAWLVPEDEHTARVGVAAYRNAGEEFKRLIRDRCSDGKILEWQSGVIPIYNPKHLIQKDNVRLVGDAACHVKATTYGGILFGMLAARELSNDIDNYSENVRKHLAKELNLALKIRKMMDKFSDEDYNELISLCEKDKVKRIFERHDRDYPSKMLFKLMVAQPAFLKFAKKLI